MPFNLPMQDVQHAQHPRIQSLQIQRQIPPVILFWLIKAFYTHCAKNNNSSVFFFLQTQGNYENRRHLDYQMSRPTINQSARLIGSVARLRCPCRV